MQCRGTKATVQTFSDDQLIRLIRAGDKAAFGILYERYRVPLYRFCVRMIGDNDQAADAVHETFLKLYHSAEDMNEPALVRVWLYRVARNEVLMALRREHRGVDSNTVWDSETPQTILEQVELSAALEASLQDLKPEYKDILLLREMDGLSYSEIADVTGKSESSVKSRLFKARKALALALAPRLGERRTV